MRGVSAATGSAAAENWPPAPGGTWIVDLDGVVWLAGDPIAGVPEGLARLRSVGVRTLFASNNSSLTIGEVVTRLQRAGVEADHDDVVTSAQAGAALVEPGATVLVLAGPGVLEALAARGATPVERGPADAVMVGFTREFDFGGLTEAADTVRGGARLIGTNDDATYPTPDGLLPGAGSLLAAVVTASGVTPEIAGKPNAAMARLIASRADDTVCVVGDRPSTDGLLARRLGLPYALVFSGVTRPGATLVEPTPAVTATDLGALARDVLEQWAR